MNVSRLFKGEVKTVLDWLSDIVEKNECEFMFIRTKNIKYIYIYRNYFN